MDYNNNKENYVNFNDTYSTLNYPDNNTHIKRKYDSPTLTHQPKHKRQDVSLSYHHVLMQFFLKIYFLKFDFDHQR